MTNWKTSAAGLISAVSLFIVGYGVDLHFYPWLMAVGKFTAAGGLAFMGLASKDSTTHSTLTEVEQSTVKKDSKEGAGPVP